MVECFFKVIIHNIAIYCNPAALLQYIFTGDVHYSYSLNSAHSSTRVESLEKIAYANIPTHVTVSKQYNLVPAKGVISLVWKVTSGLVKSKGSLPPGL